MNERKGKEGMKEGWIGWGSTVRAAAATMGDAFFSTSVCPFPRFNSSFFPLSPCRMSIPFSDGEQR